MENRLAPKFTLRLRALNPVRERILEVVGLSDCMEPQFFSWGGTFISTPALYLECNKSSLQIWPTPFLRELAVEEEDRRNFHLFASTPLLHYLVPLGAFSVAVHAMPCS